MPLVEEVHMNYLHNFCKTYFERRYINSMLAKPFVILSGNSGTGKTRIACKFSKQYSVSIPDYTNLLVIYCNLEY